MFCYSSKSLGGANNLPLFDDDKTFKYMNRVSLKRLIIILICKLKINKYQAPPQNMISKIFFKIIQDFLENRISDDVKPQLEEIANNFSDQVTTWASNFSEPIGFQSHCGGRPIEKRAIWQYRRSVG